MFVFHQGVDAGGRHEHAAQQAAAVKLEFKGFTCGQGHSSKVGHDDATVAHLRRKQSDVAAQRSAEFALVDDFACGAIAGQFELAIHELLVGGVVRGGHKTAHVYAGRFAKVNTFGVNQNNLPRRCDAAKDVAGLAIHHAVERG